jgi:hypothetical protein
MDAEFLTSLFLEILASSSWGGIPGGNPRSIVSNRGPFFETPPTRLPRMECSVPFLNYDRRRADPSEILNRRKAQIG